MEIILLLFIGIPIPETIYAWLAVFILPINSALNPVLYTLTTTIFRKQIRKLLNSCLNKKNIEHHPQSASESAFSLSFGVFPSSRRILSYRVGNFIFSCLFIDNLKLFRRALKAVV